MSFIGTMDSYSPPVWVTTQLPHACSECVLEVLKDGSVAEKLSIGRKPTYAFGRAADAVDFAVLHATASRRHCSLVWGTPPGTVSLGLYAVDLGSTHGTFLGRGDSRKRLEANTPVQLHTGSVLSFGESTRLYLCVSVPEAADLAPKPTQVQAQAQGDDAGGGVSWGIMDAEPDQQQDDDHDSDAAATASSQQRKRARQEDTSFNAGGKRAYLRELADEGPVVQGDDAPREFAGDASAVLSMLGGGRGAGGPGGDTDTGPLAWMNKLDHKNLTDKEKASLDKIRAKTLRIKSISTESDRIRAKESTQGGLSEGQQGQLDRNEGLIEDLEQEVEAQAEDLRNRMESRRPGCTGMPVHASDNASVPSAFTAIDKASAGLEEDDLFSRTIDRTASMAAGKPKATFVLSRSRFAGAVKPSMPSTGAPAHVGKVETESSLLASLRRNMREVAELLKEEQDAAGAHASSETQGDDAISAALAAARAAEAAAAQRRRADRVAGLRAEAHRLERLLDIVNAEWRVNMTVVEEKTDVVTPVIAAASSAAPGAAIPVSASSAPAGQPVASSTPSAGATTHSMAPPPPPLAFKPAAAPVPQSTGKSSSGLSNLLSSSLAAAGGSSSTGGLGCESTAASHARAHAEKGGPAPVRQSAVSTRPAVPKYDSDDVVDLSRLV